MSSPFHFKKFSIHQENAAHKVGTDGVLLGAWANVSGKRILDVGTGTGLLALMAAQRNSRARIDAIEIESAAQKDAAINFNQSPFADQIKLFNTDFLGFNPEYQYDNILCNPPYFVNALPSPDQGRNAARQLSEKQMKPFLQKLFSFLHSNNKLTLILPYNSDLHKFIDREFSSNLISRITLVRSYIDHPPKRLLMEFCPNNPNPKENQLVIMDNDGNYSHQFITLTKDFYPFFNKE